MLSVRFILSVFSLCTFFSVVAAAPLFDQAPIVPDDTVVDQSSGDPEPQPDLRESASLLKGWFSPPDYCKCTTKYFEHLAALSTPKDGSLITYSGYVYFKCLKKCPEAQAMNAVDGKRDEILEIPVGGTEVDDLHEGGEPLPLQRFNPPDYCKCTSKYLQCLALGKISSSNPLFNPNVETCNEHYFSCLNKCPAAQAMAGMDGKRARIPGGLISGLAEIISGTIGKSHLHKSSKPPTRSLSFLPPSYAVAGQYYTPKPKKPNTKGKPGKPTLQSTSSTLWPPSKREQEALETCGCESKYVGPDLVSCLGMCFEDPTIRMDATDPSTGNTKRQGLPSNEMPPKSKSTSDGHPPEQEHHEDDQSSSDIPAVDQGPNPDDSTHIPNPFTINTPIKRVVKTSTCGCESKGYNWTDLNNCLTICFKSQPKACVMIIPPGGLQKRSPSSSPDPSLMHPIVPPASMPLAQATCEFHCASNFPNNANQQYTCMNACYKARGSTCVAILGQADTNPNVVYIAQENPKFFTNLKLSRDDATPLGVSLFPHLVETADDDEQHKPSKNSRIMRRSLPYMNPPYAQPAELARPGEKGYEEVHGSGVGTAAQKDEGLSVGVLLFFFGCSMTPLLVLVWVGRMYRGEKYQRVSRG